MKRTTFEFKIKDYNSANQVISSLLATEKYQQCNENNEMVWKCGTGFLTAIKYIKYEFTNNNSVIVSGWIRPVGGKEQDLNGFVGAVPKKQVINTINKIQTSLLQ